MCPLTLLTHPSLPEPGCVALPTTAVTVTPSLFLSWLGCNWPRTCQLLWPCWVLTLKVELHITKQTWSFQPHVCLKICLEETFVRRNWKLRGKSFSPSTCLLQILFPMQFFCFPQHDSWDQLAINSGRCTLLLLFPITLHSHSYPGTCLKNVFAGMTYSSVFWHYTIFLRSQTQGKQGY